MAIEYKLLTLHDIADLDYLAEEVLHALRFSGFHYDADGNFLLHQDLMEERILDFFRSAPENILEFRESRIVRELSLTELCALNLEDIKRNYLAEILPKARNTMRAQAPYIVCGRLSAEISDAYLEDLFAIHWRWNAMLSVVQKKQNGGAPDDEPLEKDDPGAPQT